MKNRAPWVLLLCLPLIAQAESTVQREITEVLALKPDLAGGGVLFEKCAVCHKADGSGDVSGAIPRIAGQHYRVLVRQLVSFRRGERWDMRMEGVATSHEMIPGLQDIADVASFVSQLDTSGARGIGDGAYVDRGAKIFAERCASCHGREAEGNAAKAVPRLAGQHAGYLARQIYDAVDGRRPQLTRTHASRFKPFSYEEVLGLTDYLSRIGWDERQPAGAASGSPSPGSR